MKICYVFSDERERERERERELMGRTDAALEALEQSINVDVVHALS